MSKTISRWPAWLDIVQGGTGLFLVLFMWVHMFFVSSILLGKDAMYTVARLFEGEPVFGEPYPIIVSLFGSFILAIIIVHAVLAVRKIPSSYREYSRMNQHLGRFKHHDSWLWYVQVVTGFALMFLATVHLYQIIINPAAIGPYASADRVWSGRMWPLYLVLLFVVEVHGGVGLYRLIIKWGWFMGDDVKASRKRLQKIKWSITGFFLLLGILTLGAYMKIGAEHADNVGERYQPVAEQSSASSSVNPTLARKE